jgi:xanthine dehydrogenase accessory factor
MLKNVVPSDLAPLEACAASKEACILAVVVGVEGPSYRPVGATMAFFCQRAPIGSLSSGCIESDIKLHAFQCLEEGLPRLLRYGRGSPYKDIILPCGGGLQIILIPNPDRALIREVLRSVVVDRKANTLGININTGEMSADPDQVVGLMGENFVIRIEPELRFLVFGKGPEPIAFSALTQSAGFETTLLSPDFSTLESAQNMSCKTVEIRKHCIPSVMSADSRTAIVLFFHDHDWEPPILIEALKTSAFYIGAQGSQRARDTRFAALRKMHVKSNELLRLSGPIGIIASARDPRTLAISVLAEVISKGTSATL